MNEEVTYDPNTGKRQMRVTSFFDGELIWIWMRGTYSWFDGKFTHAWTHALYPEAFMDMIKTVTAAISYYEYQTEVVPCIEEEVGNAEVFEYNKYSDYNAFGEDINPCSD